MPTELLWRPAKTALQVSPCFWLVAMPQAMGCAFITLCSLMSKSKLPAAPAVLTAPCTSSLNQPSIITSLPALASSHATICCSPLYDAPSQLVLSLFSMGRIIIGWLLNHNCACSTILLDTLQPLELRHCLFVSTFQFAELDSLVKCSGPLKLFRSCPTFASVVQA